MRLLVHFEVGETQDAAVGGLRQLRPPQDGTDAQHDLFKTERFGDIVVCTDGQAGDPVFDRMARGEEENRGARAFLAQAAGHLEAVDVGQHHVEHDQVWLELLGGGERLGAGRGCPNIELDQSQCGAQQREDVRLVVDHQHLGFHIDRSIR